MMVAAPSHAIAGPIVHVRSDGLDDARAFLPEMRGSGTGRNCPVRW